MDLWQEFHGPNAGYVLELFERYQRDPGSVDAEARAFFEQSPPGLFDGDGAAAPAAAAIPPVQAEKIAGAPEKITGVSNLAQAVRWYGHWAAHLDPLGSLPPDDPALHLETYGLSETDLRRLPASLVGGVAGERTAANDGSAYDAVQYLREIYSGSVGHDYLQIRDPDERQWLREAAESRRFSVEHAPFDPLAMLERLTQVEVFEHFLQRSFVAKTRFSIEGLDSLVPLLDAITGMAAESGIYNILIGMAHRGRLNVLAHILNKPYMQILAEFKDPLARIVLENETVGWAGDVKYHAGASHTLEDHDPTTIDLIISMAPNPSHLEAVNPVVEGMARAAGARTGQPGPGEFDPSITLPVLIHGDAAFPGQGVVAETLNMHRLQGYSTGGTIHIIANNQIGFTTNPNELRSTLFASDLAKGYRIPIIHVNADDPEGVIMAARIAFAYRARFQRDFLIDLIGYRRWGHNEGDEPAFTHPVEYKKIAAHPSVRKLWADRLVQHGEIAAALPDQIYQRCMDEMQQELEKLDPEGSLAVPIPPYPASRRGAQSKDQCSQGAADPDQSGADAPAGRLYPAPAPGAHPAAAGKHPHRR